MSKECRERECNNDCLKCDIYLKILAERAKDYGMQYKDYRMLYADAMTAKSNALYDRRQKKSDHTD